MIIIKYFIFVSIYQQNNSWIDLLNPPTIFYLLHEVNRSV